MNKPLFVYGNDERYNDEINGYKKGQFELKTEKFPQKENYEELQEKGMAKLWYKDDKNNK